MFQPRQDYGGGGGVLRFRMIMMSELGVVEILLISEA
jgi:hypothetical protein